jgi:hypothetical protein
MASATRGAGRKDDGEAKLRIAIVNEDKVRAVEVHARLPSLGLTASFARSASPRNADRNAKRGAQSSAKVRRPGEFRSEGGRSTSPWFAGKLCIEVTPTSKLAFISETVCALWACVVALAFSRACPAAVHRVRHLRQEMPVRGDSDHQPSF